MKGERNPWERYWSQPSANARLACADGLMGPLLDNLWKDFAERLPPKGSCLDLGTGSGVVLTTLRKHRPDLKLVGVDASPVLPAPPQGVQLKAGTSMENLPFPDRRFNALTSQFGFEYGTTQLIAKEAARVIRPRGQFQLIIHHTESPIVAHNKARSSALRWAVDTSQCVTRARKLAATGLAGTSSALDQSYLDARQLFPRQGVAAEFVQGLTQLLNGGVGQSPMHLVRLVDELEERARDEMARIDALAAAAKNEDELANIVGELESVGLVVTSFRAVADLAGTPVAWLIEGRSHNA